MSIDCSTSSWRLALGIFFFYLHCSKNFKASLLLLCRQAWVCFYKYSDTVRGVITYLQYRYFPVDFIYNNRSHNYHSLCETKQNIFLYTTMLYRVFDLLRFSGVDGSRTRVQKPIPCPSTSVVYSLTFPPRPGNKHPEHFSSFMLRPYAQSFAYVVSHMFEAGILRCECPRADCYH